MKKTHKMSHDEFVVYIDTLAEMISHYQSFNGKIDKIDYIVGIPRGGIVPTIYLSHRLGIEVASIDDVLKGNMRDKNIVICDEIVDSGATLQRTKDLLKDCANNLVYVSVIMKSDAQHKPDFYVRTFSHGLWIIFPWEVGEKEAKK